MVLAFFNSEGLIYTSHLPIGEYSTPSMYIIEALARFLRVFNQKRPPIARRDWWFH